jgi:hypothetical protein
MASLTGGGVIISCWWLLSITGWRAFEQTTVRSFVGMSLRKLTTAGGQTLGPEVEGNMDQRVE